MRTTSTFSSEYKTPALVFDIENLRQDVTGSQEIANAIGGTLLYSIKACSVPRVLSLIADSVAGFSCSSPYEVRLARRFAGANTTVHLTSPGLDQGQVLSAGTDCNYISFNSPSQYSRLAPLLPHRVSCGLRINPETKFVADNRYNPCRQDSKLGTTLQLAFGVLQGDSRLKGIHVHNNCESTDLRELGSTINIISVELRDVLARLDWINLGGGYLLSHANGVAALSAQVANLVKRFDLEVFLEPGAAIIRRAGNLVSRIVDILQSGQSSVAILDTTVNHWPEVFEYQFQPDVAEATEGGPYEYILGGCSCLAGDVFGNYQFSHPLDVGSQITFQDAGAYSIVKSHYFNGIRLPSIYVKHRSGELGLIAEFPFDDYLSHIGGEYDYAFATD